MFYFLANLVIDKGEHVNRCQWTSITKHGGAFDFALVIQVVWLSLALVSGCTVRRHTQYQEIGLYNVLAVSWCR